MTPTERRLAFALAHVPARGRGISPDRFLAEVGAEDGATWALEAMRDALTRRDADDAEAAVVVGGAFGYDRRWSGLLVELLDSDWHVLHETAAHELGRVGGPGAVLALVRATRQVPDHLTYDGGRALARKAVHSLGRIGGPEADAALETLAGASDETLRTTVQRVLDRRRRGG